MHFVNDFYAIPDKPTTFTNMNYGHQMKWKEENVIVCIHSEAYNIFVSLEQV